MTNKITSTLALTALAAAMAAPGAFAQSAAGQGYVRGELGKTTLKAEGDSVKDTSVGLRGGYWFNRNFALEGSYNRLYDKTVGDRYSLSNVTIDNQTSTRLHSLGLGVVGKVRFGDQAADTGFFGMGRAGVARNTLRYRQISTDSVTGGKTTYSESKGSTNPYVGVGVGYDFAPNMGVSLNYDYQKAKISKINFDAHTYSAGFEYRF